MRSIEEPWFRRLLCICLILIVSFSIACGTASDIEAGRRDLPDSIQSLLIHKYGHDGIPTKMQFGPMKALQDLYGRFIPYYVTGFFNSDEYEDFATLSFGKETIQVVLGQANVTGDYDLITIETGFLNRLEGENEIYLLLAKPGRHFTWDGRAVDLSHTGFYVGSVDGPEYLFYWKQTLLKQVTSRD